MLADFVVERHNLMREDMLGVEAVEYVDDLKEGCQVLRVQPLSAVCHWRPQVYFVLGFKGINVDVQVVYEDIHQFPQSTSQD